jgi:hypothetical protein
MRPVPGLPEMFYFRRKPNLVQHLRGGTLGIQFHPRGPRVLFLVNRGGLWIHGSYFRFRHVWPRFSEAPGLHDGPGRRAGQVLPGRDGRPEVRQVHVRQFNKLLGAESDHVQKMYFYGRSISDPRSFFFRDSVRPLAMLRGPLPPRVQGNFRNFVPRDGRRDYFCENSGKFAGALVGII